MRLMWGILVRHVENENKTFQVDSSKLYIAEDKCISIAFVTNATWIFITMLKYFLERNRMYLWGMI